MTRPLSFGVYLPQVQFSFAEIRDRVLACEAAGVDSVWFMDHLHPPRIPDVPSFEGWTLAAALAPLTKRWLRSGLARTILLMWWLRALYFLGVSPGRLARVYREVR